MKKLWMSILFLAVMMALVACNEQGEVPTTSPNSSQLLPTPTTTKKEENVYDTSNHSYKVVSSNNNWDLNEETYLLKETSVKGIFYIYFTPIEDCSIMINEDGVEGKTWGKNNGIIECSEKAQGIDLLKDTCYKIFFNPNSKEIISIKPYQPMEDLYAYNFDEDVKMEFGIYGYEALINVNYNEAFIFRREKKMNFVVGYDKATQTIGRVAFDSTNYLTSTIVNERIHITFDYESGTLFMEGISLAETNTYLVQLKKNMANEMLNFKNSHVGVMEIDEEKINNAKTITEVLTIKKAFFLQYGDFPFSISGLFLALKQENIMMDSEISVMGIIRENDQQKKVIVIVEEEKIISIDTNTCPISLLETLNIGKKVKVKGILTQKEGVIFVTGNEEIILGICLLNE